VDPLGLTTCDPNGNNCYDSVTVTAGGGVSSGPDLSDLFGGGGGGHPMYAPLQDGPSFPGVPGAAGARNLANALAPASPAPPPGYEDCIIAALLEVLASGETPNEANPYGTVVRGTVMSAHDPYQIFVGQSNVHLDPNWVIGLGQPGIFVQVHPGDPPNKWSSAFGRYQITYTLATDPRFNFTDFSPWGQDAAATTLLKYYDAVQLAMQGNF
jgi:hypothetical protein